MSLLEQLQESLAAMIFKRLACWREQGIEFSEQEYVDLIKRDYPDCDSETVKLVLRKLGY